MTKHNRPITEDIFQGISTLKCIMEKITILLVDDHRLLRDMWATILHDDGRFEIVGSGVGDSTILWMARKYQPAVALVDIAMTPIDGFELTRELLFRCPALKVIGVTMYNQPAYMKKMFKAGAKGYLTKNSSKEEMIKAIIEVHEGGEYVCEDLLELFSAHKLRGVSYHLTARELEIISLLKLGKSSREIGDLLCVERKTIEVHRYNILKKLKLPNTASLVNYANVNGF